MIDQTDSEDWSELHLKDQNFFLELFSVVDNLERAIAHAPSSSEWTAGVQIVLRQLLGALTRKGLISLGLKGEPFNPHIHQAVLQKPTYSVPSGCVAEVFQRGWLLGEHLIRPAMVSVCNRHSYCHKTYSN